VVEFLDGVQDDAKDMILAENAGMASSMALLGTRTQRECLPKFTTY